MMLNCADRLTGAPHPRYFHFSDSVVLYPSKEKGPRKNGLRSFAALLHLHILFIQAGYKYPFPFGAVPE